MNQLWRKCLAYQSVGIFGVIQETIELAAVALILFMVVVSEQQHVEQQLHVVFLLSLWRVRVGLRKSALARLLFNHYALVILHHVHTTLQSEHL